MNKFGEVLKDWRQERNLTQLDLSIKSEIPLTTIQKYERGVFNPKIENIDKLAKALEVDPMKLFLNTPDGEIIFEWFV